MEPHRAITGNVESDHGVNRLLRFRHPAVAALIVWWCAHGLEVPAGWVLGTWAVLSLTFAALERLWLDELT